MTITARACAEFHDKSGKILYRIDPGHLYQIIENVPESIKQDPLFAMMVREKTISFTDEKDGTRDLEKAAEAAAAGTPAPAADPASEKPKPTRKSKSAQSAAAPAADPAAPDAGASASTPATDTPDPAQAT